MTTTEATAEVFWTAFRALSKKEREAVVEKLEIVSKLCDPVWIM